MYVHCVYIIIYDVSYRERKRSWQGGIVVKNNTEPEGVPTNYNPYVRASSEPK
jgi:hypothetical protein